MQRLDDYLMEVQHRNGLNSVPLISAWTQAEISAVENALRTAVATSNIINSAIPNFAGISNQANWVRLEFAWKRKRQPIGKMVTETVAC